MPINDSIHCIPFSAVHPYGYPYSHYNGASEDHSLRLPSYLRINQTSSQLCLTLSGGGSSTFNAVDRIIIREGFIAVCGLDLIVRTIRIFRDVEICTYGRSGSYKSESNLVGLRKINVCSKIE